MMPVKRNGCLIRGISDNRNAPFFSVMSAPVPTFQPCDDGLPLRTAVQSFDDVLHVLAHSGDGYAESFGYLAIRQILVRAQIHDGFLHVGERGLRLSIAFQLRISAIGVSKPGRKHPERTRETACSSCVSSPLPTSPCAPAAASAASAAQ
mgnify:CR=1 FL=1